MIHKPIQIKQLSLSFASKTCFENFTTQINYGDRIAIIGRNGSGKSTLLKILQGVYAATDGEIQISSDVIIGYVPQVIEQYNSLSGGQRLNKSLTEALSVNPNILLLDEPTNHLDQQNRRSMLRMLQAYSGTLIIVSHDMEVLNNCVDKLWHIDQGNVHIFSGHYDDYLREISSKRAAIEHKLGYLDRQKDMHAALMKEQHRAAKSKIKGQKSIEQRKWPTVVSKSKALAAEETSGRKKIAISGKKQELTEQLANLRLPEIILPTFSFSAADINDRVLLAIRNGEVGYQTKPLLLRNINLSLSSNVRLAIVGNNGSGKSTLLRAILNDPTIIKTGSWYMPKQEDIGYLDQHYSTLDSEKSVLESISELVPIWSHIKVRRHLTDFLFRTNEEVNTRVSQLSGGEKARLSLAQIAAKTPELLILDEVTNNLDLETKKHVIDILKIYPGSMIIVSHDEGFLKEIDVAEYYRLS